MTWGTVDICVYCKNVSHRHGYVYGQYRPSTLGKSQKVSGKALIQYVQTLTNEYSCVAKHSTCFIGAWARSNRPETQSMHWDSTHPSHRASNLWKQIWWELQDNQAILRLVYIVTWRTTCHQYGATHAICLMGTCARSNKPDTQSIH